MKRLFGKGSPLLLCIAAQLGGCTDNADQANYLAQVQRTAFGIPHIVAADEKGLGYGAGYAYAQDNFCLLAEEIITAQGQRARYFGAEGSYDPGEGNALLNVASDFYYAMHNEASLVKASFERQPAEIKALLNGYSAGVNRYLRDTGLQHLPQACKDKTWVRNIDALDLIRMMRRYAVAESGARYIRALYAATPPQPEMAGAPTHRRSLAVAPFFMGRQQSAARLGSNAIALGRDATQTGNGMLYANPHFPWNGAYRFYQQHLTIPGKVDVMGGALMGMPVVNIGHNRDVAWTHTVNTSLHSTLFALRLVDGNPLQYLVDGAVKPLRPHEVSISVSHADGTLSTLKHTFYLSEYGPLLVLPGILDWNATTAYALADANQDNDRLLATWWRLNRAGSVAEMRQTIESTLGMPWVNTIATDKAGQAYFSAITVVPKVSHAQEAACVPEAAQPFLAQGVMVLDGSTAACRWGNTAGTPQPGIFAANELPSLLRTDFVQNSNDSAWLSNPAQPLSAYPSVVSRAGTEQNGRTRYGLQQILARLNGQSGQAAQRFSLPALQAMGLSNRSFFASVLLNDLKQLCRDSLPQQVPLAACHVLAQWDGKAELDSVGWPLFLAWREQLAESGTDFWAVPFDPAQPVETPRGLRLDNAAVVQAARTALFAAVATLDEMGIDFSRPWGETQAAAHGNLRIPLHGGGGEDIYNVIESKPTGKGQLDVVFGSSFLLAVSFEGASPRAEGFLTFAQSSNPASPFYRDQTERFSRKAWIRFPYTTEEIRRDPAYTSKLIWE